MLLVRAAAAFHLCTRVFLLKDNPPPVLRIMGGWPPIGPPLAEKVRGWPVPDRVGETLIIPAPAPPPQSAHLFRPTFFSTLQSLFMSDTEHVRKAFF
jgi:hypothetical protein